MPESALTSRISSPEAIAQTAKVILDTVRQIVHHPFRVRMRTRTDGRGVLLDLFVAPEDLGRVIGKQGRTVRSLRVILSTISSKTDVRFELDVQAEQV